VQTTTENESRTVIAITKTPIAQQQDAQQQNNDIKDLPKLHVDKVIGPCVGQTIK